MRSIDTRETLELSYTVIETKDELGRYTRVGWCMNLEGVEYGRLVSIYIDPADRELALERVRRNVWQTVTRRMQPCARPHKKIKKKKAKK